MKIISRALCGLLFIAAPLVAQTNIQGSQIQIGGVMSWPGSGGIPNYSGSNSWGNTYNSGNPIPNNFLFGSGVLTINGTPCTLGTSCSPPGGATISATTALLKGTGVGNQGVAAGFSDVVGLFGSGSCIGFLKNDGTCGNAGALFPGTNAIVVNTSTLASRNAVFGDVVSLFGSGSCSGFLKNDGTCSSSTSSPAGSNTQVQYNNSGAFAGSSGFVFNNSTNALTIGGPYNGSNAYVQGTDPVFGVANSGEYAGNVFNHTEDRNAFTILAGGAHGTALPQAQGFQLQDTFKGLGHLWRFSTQTEGATTQIGRYYQYYSGTPGQSIFEGGTQMFLGDGDQISREDFQYCGGNGGQENAENCHSAWHFIQSPTNAGPGACLGGCGNTNQSSIIWGGGVGQGSLLYDFTDVQAATIVSGAGGTAGLPWSSVALSGVSLTASKLFQIPQAIAIDQNVTAGSAAGSPWQPTSVTVAISTTPVYTGALSSTSTLATDGVGCLANPPTTSGLSNEADSLEEWEPVFYHVVDTTHLQLWTTLTHSTNSIFAVGGSCGQGIEQKAQTDAQGTRTIYPIIASIDATHVIYAGGNLAGAVIGTSGVRNFENGSCSVTNVSRSGTTATITTSGCAGVVGGLNGKPATISGMTADAALNGTFTITTNNIANQYTYTAGSGTIAPTSQTGTLKTGDTVGNLYPVTEVLVPWNPANPSNNQWYLTSPFTFPTVSAQVGRAAPYYSQIQGDANTLSPNEDPYLGSIGGQIIMSAGSARQQNPGGVGSPFIGLNIQNKTTPAGVYQNFGGTYLPPDYAIKVAGLWQQGVHFDSSNAVGMFFDKNGTPPGATGWNYCAFIAADGVSLCGTDVLAGGQSQLNLNVGGFNFNNTVGSNRALEVDPEFNSSEGLIKSHSPTVIAPDHIATNKFSLIVNPGSGGTNALQTTGYANMTGLQSGLTCADFLGVDSSGNVGLFNPGCAGTGGAVASVSNSDGTLTVTPTTGAVVASLNTAHANTWTALQTFSNGIATSGTLQALWAAGVGTGTIPTTGFPTNYAGWVGPASGTPNYFASLPNANPSAAGVMILGASSVVNGVNQAPITTVPYVADTTTTSATTAVAANSCDASATTITMTGLATSMTINFTPSSDTTGVTGWGSPSAGLLYIVAWPSAANTVSYKRCNGTGSSITPGAVTWNVSAR